MQMEEVRKCHWDDILYLPIWSMSATHLDKSDLAYKANMQ